MTTTNNIIARTIARELATLRDPSGSSIYPDDTDNNMPEDIRPLALARLAAIARVQHVDGCDVSLIRDEPHGWTARVGRDANGTAIVTGASDIVEYEIRRAQVHGRALGCDAYVEWFSVGRAAGCRMGTCMVATFTACWHEALAAADALTTTNAGGLPHPSYAREIVAFGILEGIACHPLGVLAFVAGIIEMPEDDGVILREFTPRFPVPAEVQAA